MLAWAGRGTQLPLGFSALRMEMYRLHCWAEVRSSHAGRAYGRRCLTNPVHLLCRALRMAPSCYRRFELAAGYEKIHIIGAGCLHVLGRQHTTHGSKDVFDSITSLAAAMLRYASAENLSVALSPDESAILVHRIGEDCFVGGAQWHV